MARLDQPSNICKACSIELPIGMFYEVKGRHGVRYADNTCKKCRFVKVQAAKAKALIDAEEANRRRLWRMDHKRKVRRNQGCKTRTQLKAIAQCNEQIKHRSRIARREHAKWLALDCNAHVKRYRKALAARQRAAALYATPKGAIDVRMRTAIWKALRGDKAGRGWEKLVGYSAEQLVAHLEGQFTAGMDWTNIGKWHIDHIVPRKLFNYHTATADDSDFKQCWALSNLQPLWAIDNIRKSDHYLTLI